MSASRRRRTPRPAREAPADELEPLDDDELETLEPLDEDELETLEPLEDEGGVEVKLVDADEDGYDVCLDVHVPDMPKADVPNAVAAPLAAGTARHGSALRWKRVIVRFSGQALIPSAIKELVASTLADARPAKVLVQRGYPNEVVHEATMPTVRVTTTDEGTATRVSIDTGELEAADLPVAMETELVRLASTASGKAYSFTFTGNERPDAAARAAIKNALAKAGAVRATVGSASDGESLLFDRELEARVRMTDTANGAEIVVTPAEDEQVTVQALELVVPPARERLAGKPVRVRFAERAPRAAELAALHTLAESMDLVRLDLDRGDGDIDVLAPRLLRSVSKGDKALIGVLEGGRSRRGVIDAFRREIATLEDTVRDRHVTVDWPAGFAIDEDVERACLDDALASLGPKSVSCTFGGGEKEPYLPHPVELSTEQDGYGELRVIRFDTDAAKPAELARALDRRLDRVRRDLAGRRVRARVVGSGALSRTMLRTLRESIENARASRLELDDHGKIDVLLPDLLTVERGNAGVVAITADPSHREPAQVEAALERELDALDAPSDTTYRVAPSPLTESLVAALIARGASRVLIDGDPPLQVHPKLFGEPRRDADRLTIPAAPAGDDAVLTAQVGAELPAILRSHAPLTETDVTLAWPGAGDPHPAPLVAALDAILAASPRKLLLDTGTGRAKQLFPEIVPDWVVVLGRKTDAEPPLVMLGVDRGAGEDHRRAVLEKLESLRPEIEGRRVLVVMREDDAEFAAADRDPLVKSVQAFVDGISAATLLSRGDSFEVVHSNVESLPVGGRVRDPRPGK